VQVIITTIFVLQSCFETIHFEKCYNTVDLTLIICMSHLRHITHKVHWYYAYLCWYVG